jgi:hypothetical protein
MGDTATLNASCVEHYEGLRADNALQKIWNFPELIQVFVTRAELEPKEARSSFEDSKGWVKHRASVWLLDGSQTLKDALFAEWTDGLSYFRAFPNPASPESLLHTKITESETGDPFLRQVVDVIGDGAANGKVLRYHIYWKVASDGTVERAFDAFTGFSIFDSTVGDN